MIKADHSSTSEFDYVGESKMSLFANFKLSKLPDPRSASVISCSRKDKYFDLACYMQSGLGARNFLAIAFPGIKFSNPETQQMFHS